MYIKQDKIPVPMYPRLPPIYIFQIQPKSVYLRLAPIRVSNNSQNLIIVHEPNITQTLYKHKSMYLRPYTNPSIPYTAYHPQSMYFRPD